MHRFLIVLPFLFLSCREEESAPPPPGPMPLKVASPFRQIIEAKKTYSGRFIPRERVAVRARVSGYLDSVHFQEGQRVNEGDLLFRIDPRLFDAEVRRASARLEQVTSALRLAQENYDRAAKLVKQRAISQEEVDIRLSEVDRATADIQVAEARLESARLNRSFAEITAPISGIANRFEITRGNYITGGSSASEILTTIVPHDPIYCVFEVDEKQVLQFTRLYFEGKASGRGGKSPVVEIAVSDADDYKFRGEINFAENELDPSTATLQMRARVPNPDKFLTPGLFARVRIPIGAPAEELLVQEAALGFDQDKRFVWLLSENQDGATMSKRYVEVGAQQGKYRIIRKGLTEQDKIAVAKIQLIRPGSRVEPVETKMMPELPEAE